MSRLPEELARRTPPGQALTTRWPALTCGLTPRFGAGEWSFRCSGLVEKEAAWTWEELLQIPRAQALCDIHGVNGYHMHADPWKEERSSDQQTRAMQTMRADAARKLRGR
jgi:DMSO/TMAO reductase YedYZ molybdopterin-dependent catalytic subunit